MAVTVTTKVNHCNQKAFIFVFMCVRTYQIAYNRAIPPCHPISNNSYMRLALLVVVCICRIGPPKRVLCVCAGVCVIYVVQHFHGTHGNYSKYFCFVSIRY